MPKHKVQFKLSISGGELALLGAKDLKSGGQHTVAIGFCASTAQISWRKKSAVRQSRPRRRTDAACSRVPDRDAALTVSGSALHFLSPPTRSFSTFYFGMLMSPSYQQISSRSRDRNSCQHNQQQQTLFLFFVSPDVKKIYF